MFKEEFTIQRPWIYIDVKQRTKFLLSKLAISPNKAFIHGKELCYTNHTHTQYAASSHNHSASQITSGILPVSRGGTGVTSIAALKTTLGIGQTGGDGSIFSVSDTLLFDDNCYTYRLPKSAIYIEITGTNYYREDQTGQVIQTTVTTKIGRNPNWSNSENSPDKSIGGFVIVFTVVPAWINRTTNCYAALSNDGKMMAYYCDDGNSNCAITIIGY